MAWGATALQIQMAFWYRGETQELNELARKEANGLFIQLSDGITHYELSNPDVEETVVLVHGFSVPYFIYDPTFEFLTRSRFRVLRYDLFGRGFSDRPDTRYNMDLFVRQLDNLLDALRWRRPVSLVGLSTGGPITASFTVRFPGRVEKLVLIDPVGARLSALSLLLRFAAMPLLGEVLINILGSEGIVKNIASDFFDDEHINDFQAQYLVQMHLKGFKRAILSTIRNNMLGSFRDVYEHIGKMDIPVLLFWGRQDRTVPFRHSEILRGVMPGVQFHAIQDAGHIPHFEKSEEVNPILLKFLRS